MDRDREVWGIDGELCSVGRVTAQRLLHGGDKAEPQNVPLLVQFHEGISSQSGIRRSHPHMLLSDVR